jgi:hypothetical protein
MTAGRILAVRPKSTRQTSPRFALGMFRLGLIVNLKGFVWGGNQIRPGFNPMRVVIDHAAAALTELPVNRLFHAQQFFGG